MQIALKGVLNSYWPTLSVVLFVAILLRITYIIRSDRSSFKIHEEIMKLFFIAYLMILFEMVLCQDMGTGGTNLMPFREILRYDFGTRSFYKQVVGNILAFVPLGYFASMYCRIKNLGVISFITLLISLAIEFVQRFIGRCFDIDDIILNVVGGIVGFLIYVCLSAIKKHLPKILQKDIIYDILTIFLLVLVALYIIRIF